MAHTLITTVLPFIGIVTSNLIALTLLPTLQSAWKTRTIFPKAPTPILFLFPPQLFFLLFAYITGDINILFANALPCIIGAAAVVIIFRCQDVNSKIGAQIIGAAIIIAIIEAYIAIILQLESAYVLVGTTADCFLLLFFAAPLLQIQQVIARKDASEFAAVLPLTGAVLLNGVIWFTYGIGKGDIFITGPNVLAIAVSIAQVSCVVRYSKAANYALVDEDIV